MASMSKSLLLVANPGSASRKYGLFKDGQKTADLHFEVENGQVVYGLNGSPPQPAGISHVTFALSKVGEILLNNQLLTSVDDIQGICVRIVAPSPYFQQHRVLDAVALKHLRSLESIAPLHISATLQEIDLLEKYIPHTRLAGISDSAFHVSMPDHANLYGIPVPDAQKLGLQRYGYHGLSVKSVISKLKAYHSLPERAIVCHLGSGSSVTAVQHGKSIDTTMGFSPLEGLIMATRSGSIDPMAAHILQSGLKLTTTKVEDYLNHKSGLLGISGVSSDIRELLLHEKSGNDNARLALAMYVYHVQQAIGQMSAALGGVDALIFTGTIGERSSIVRKRIITKLSFLGVDLDPDRNSKKVQYDSMHRISHSGNPVSVYAISTDEMSEMAQQAQQLL